MATDITPENEQYIQKAIKDGIYSDKGQAFNEAVCLLRQRDELRTEVLSGIEQATCRQESFGKDSSEM